MSKVFSRASNNKKDISTVFMFGKTLGNGRISIIKEGNFYHTKI